MKKVPVLEIFGPTIQGEGMVIGQKTMFIRTGGCDYRCSWCDSAFTWDGSQQAELLNVDEIIEKLETIGGAAFNHVTISGGNPALHSGLGEVVKMLQEKGIKTAVETQGTIWQHWMKDIDEVTISPKPPSSGMDTNWEQLDEYIRQLNDREDKEVSLKIVIFDDKDLEYAVDVHQRYPHIAMFLQTGNEHLETADNSWLLSHLLNRYEELVEKVIASERLNEVKVLPQLHTLLWGNKQGV
ncbi:7-carboxy-7-deazaguanine synthase QueE [Alteribacillus bidgolensis]|uniref:7-carboxy-7-deazaguanine synthase n=1 Tax=Alteribacillus bidgolensis TaxID=930129 RepID=A0A1G8MK26_9BACI|nr:7-carboxy-7-deazaguanine synthase QueE [Alteribacillus bidgolensis]SDI68237.1 preQ(0) biosynthesis protein QueE [Alteribacillus bidgolensis]